MSMLSPNSNSDLLTPFSTLVPTFAAVGPSEDTIRSF
jgi:hypothetical protein